MHRTSVKICKHFVHKIFESPQPSGALQYPVHLLLNILLLQAECIRRQCESEAINEFMGLDAGEKNRIYLL